MRFWFVHEVGRPEPPRRALVFADDPEQARLMAKLVKVRPPMTVHLDAPLTSSEVRAIQYLKTHQIPED